MNPSNFTREHFFCYGRSSSAFRVSTNQEGVVIERIDVGAISRSFLPDPDIVEQLGVSQNKNSYTIGLSLSAGKFFAFNKGEFGGEVWWLEKNNKSKYKVIDANPNSIVMMKDGTIYIGLRSGVSILKPGDSGYEESWLMSKECLTQKSSSIKP
jgi:hypothetical protein